MIEVKIELPRERRSIEKKGNKKPIFKPFLAVKVKDGKILLDKRNSFCPWLI